MKLLKRLSAVFMAMAVMFTSLSLTAYAEGDPQNVTITLNANGGAFADGSSEMTKEATPGVVLPYFENPTSANQVFAGWKLSADGDAIVSVMGNAPDQDTTYYAHWLDAVHVTFDPNGGSYSGSNSTTVPVPKGYISAESTDYNFMWSTYGVLANGEGFVAPDANTVFAGWSLTADGSNPIESMNYQRYDTDTTVYAIWKKAITVKVHTGDTATVVADQYVYPSSVGLNFSYSYGNGSSVTYNNQGDVTDGGKTVSFTVPVGTSFYLYNLNSATNAITESSGRAFLGWAHDAEGTVLYTDNAETKLTGDVDLVELYAIWGDGVQVTLNANNGTFSDGSTQQVRTFAENTTINSGNASNGWPTCSDATKVFYAWSTTTDESGIVIDTNGKSYALGTEDIELYALYKENVNNTNITVTYDANGKGYFSASGSRKDKVESVFGASANISSTMSAYEYMYSGHGFVPNDGYAFIGWSTDKNATEIGASISLTGDTTLYPVVVPGYKLTLDPGDASWKTGTSAYQNYVYWYNNFAQKKGMNLYALNNEFGANFGINSNQMSSVFSAPENTIFVGWTTVKNDKSTLVKYDDTLQGDTTLYACFDEKATIILDANGGYFNNSESTKTQTYEITKGSTHNIYAAPSINGEKAFYGWSTTRDESGLIADSTSYGTLSINSAKDATYYAIYKDAYVITYNYNGGTYGPSRENSQTVKVLRGERLAYSPIVSSITKQDKILVGWTDARPGTTISSENVVLSNNYSSSDYVGEYTPNKSMTLYALWEDEISVSIVAGKYGCYKSYGLTPWDYINVDEKIFKIAKGYFYGQNVPYIKDEYVGKMTFAGFAKTPDGEVEIEYDSDSQTYLIDEPGTYYAVYKPVEQVTPSAENAFSNDVTPNEVITEAEKDLKPTTAQQAEVKAQKLMNSLRARLEGTVVTTDQVEAAPGSSVMIDSIEEVKNEAAINSLQQVVTSVMKSAMAADTTIREVKLVELNARGSGSVKFLVGKEYAGTVAVVGHYHDGIWTTQQCKVDRNGYITPNFVSFSPIAIMLTTATEEFTNLETTSEPTAVDVASAAPAPSDVNGQGTNAKSPKTGEEAYNYFLLVGMICLAGSVICYMLSRKQQYR